jgi:chemotaxis family two-component system response regulator PixG
MITANTTNSPKILEKIEQLTEQKATGKLVGKAKNKEICGEIIFLSGRLVYIVQPRHRVRRWQRAIVQFAPNWKPEIISIAEDQAWESQLLHHAVNQKQISLTQVKDIIRTIAQEALFEITGYTDLVLEWEEREKKESGLALVLALSPQEIKVVLNNVSKMRKEWDTAGLRVLSPTLAPLSKSEEGEKTVSILTGLDGKLPLWDLALKKGKSISELTSVFIPFVRKGIIKFKEIPDLPSPIEPSPSVKKTTPVAKAGSQVQEKKESEEPSTPTTTRKGKALVACIDDSPVVAHDIKRMLVPAGYDVLAIPEPMRGFSSLIEQRPDLILLDINMPNANGYSVCQFLRNSPIFEKTPIIILTGQDTNIDRARAKLVGATDFVGKPAQQDILIPMLEKYLQK